MESENGMTLNSNPGQPTILVVDDTPENLTVLGELLLPFYQVRVASSGARALVTASPVGWAGFDLPTCLPVDDRVGNKLPTRDMTTSFRSREGEQRYQKSLVAL
jgi:hypothetical protein